MKTLALINGLVFSKGIFQRASVVIEGNRVIGVGEHKRIKRDYSWDSELDSEGKVVIPGLVDAHTHSFQFGVRFRPYDRPLLPWLRELVFPWESSLTPSKARACALLSYAEMLLSGTTCVSDFTSVHNTDEAFGAAAEIGIRACIGKTLMDMNSQKGLLEDTHTALEDTERLITKWNGRENGRLRFLITPRFDITCSDKLLKGCSELSKKYGVRIQTHAQENYGEISFEKKTFGASAISHFKKLGLLNKNLLLVHCVWLSGIERRLLSNNDVSVVHCPGSNIALSSGVAPVPDLLRAGVSVGLGSDVGAFDRFSIFDQMRLAMLSQRLVPKSKGISQPQVLKMATAGGAHCLGIGSEVGEIIPGRKADLVVLDAPAFVSPKNCLGWVTQGASESSVHHVMVDGKLVVKHGVLQTMSEKRLHSAARLLDK